MVGWDEVIDERQSLLTTFESLTPDQWEVPSLCSAWTVRQLLGHLVVAADPRLRHIIGPVLSARGRYDRGPPRQRPRPSPITRKGPLNWASAQLGGGGRI